MQTSIEYMIMIPLMIMQIFLFPYEASVVMGSWTNSQETLQLQEVNNYMGSAITQLYSSLNHGTINAGTVTSKVDVPAYIDGCSYNGTASLITATGDSSNSSEILDITLILCGTNIQSVVSVTLGQNAQWVNSTYISNSNNAQINATKLTDGTIAFSFIS